MIRLKQFGLLIAACLMAANAEGATLGFDGVTDGGWTLVNGADGSPANELIPVANFAGTGLNGLDFNDLTGGVMYYAAPASILTDMTGMTLDFTYQVNSSHAGGPFNVPLLGFDELIINGTGISLDIIDESILDTTQAVSIDFNDAAFGGIDLTNISSLWIKAEWWGDDVNPSVESHLLGNAVPEPGTASLLLASVLGGFGLLRKKK